MMTATISDLSEDLVKDILSRVPLISLGAVRSTCKLWNNLSKDKLLCKAEARQQFLGFMEKDSKFCSVRFDLHKDVEFVEPSVKQIDKFNQFEISEIFHSDGLLLFQVTHEHTRNTRLVVWNPYLGQTRWIQPRNSYDYSLMYAFGYDNNCNHKILIVTAKDFVIFDFKSNSWRNDVIPNWYIRGHKNSVSLKGNTYFFAQGNKTRLEPEIEACLFCFDFLIERFGPCLSLPFHIDKNNSDTVVLSSTREEQLAVLYKPWNTTEMKIWVTTNIESNALSWSKLLNS